MAPKASTPHSASSAVKVLVRCRPLLQNEHEHSNTLVQLRDDERKIYIHTNNKDEARCFTFDRVFSPDNQQDDVMKEVEPLIDHVLNGFHATVFAYGQTGSGKTYTLDGIEYVRNSSHVLVPNTRTDPKHHGIIPRAIQLMFDKARAIQGHDENARLKLKCSYYQLYNERVTDLLNPSSTRNTGTAFHGGLRIGWSREDAFRVENLFICECDDASKMRRTFFSGAREKVMESHAMNQQSSRSHCVFTIYVERWCTNSSECSLRAELSIVDLAGSEKLMMLDKNPSGTLIRESIEINASLLALGKVITALADVSKRRTRTGNSSARSHIPYRDSKLTKLLKHALGGNSLTTMIACISPSDRYVDETVSTLLYAGRARNIKNVPRVNEDPNSTIIRLLREENATLKKELEYYRNIANGTLSRAQPSSAFHSERRSSQSSSRSSHKRESESIGGVADCTRVNELADKLLEACAFLKKILAVNHELRSAFDVVKDAKTDLEGREVELNAENLALRERIEMLESIALSEDFKEDPLGHAHSSFRQQKDGTHHSPHTSNTHSVSPSTLPRRPESARPLAFSDRERDKVPHSPILIKESLGGTFPTRSVPLSHANLNTSPFPRRSRSVSAGHRKDRRQERRTKLAKKLEAYTDRYCQPHGVVNYAEYYGQARQQLPTHHAASEAISAMEQTLRQLPPDVSKMIVPDSLRRPSHFGTLTFAGDNAEVGEMEERRRQREARRHALLAQQEALHKNLDKAFAGAVGELQEAVAARAAQFGQPLRPPPYANTQTRRKPTRQMEREVVGVTAGEGLGGARRLRMYIEREEAGTANAPLGL